MTNQRQLRWAWAALLPALWLGCRAGPADPDLAAVDADSRIAGIVAAADSQDPTQLPLLVEALADDDAAVRFFAIEALERRTGQAHGYAPYAPPAERAQAVARWRAALDAQAPDSPLPSTVIAENEGPPRE